MVDARIATSAEQPINSDGSVSTVVADEGDLVSLDANGELVAADADSANTYPAAGMLATPVEDPSSYPGGQFEYAAKQAEANRAAINEDKVGYVKYGVEVVNEDGDWNFSTDGDSRVYLAVGGGLTQTAPSGTGEVAQVIGHAINDGNTIYLDVQSDYTINA